MFIDAIEVKVRDGQVANRPVYAAIGVTLAGEKEVGGGDVPVFVHLESDRGAGGEGGRRFQMRRPATNPRSAKPST